MAHGPWALTLQPYGQMPKVKSLKLKIQSLSLTQFLKAQSLKLQVSTLYTSKFIHNP